VRAIQNRSILHPALILAVLAACGLMARVHSGRTRGHPLRYACWYWHRPFRLTGDEQRQMREAHIERLYVYAGTLEARGGDIQLARRQAWSSAAPCPVYAVVRVHPAANGALLAPDGAARAETLIRSDVRLHHAPGIQWDADVPTGRLTDYARFLRNLRALMPRGQALSITALPDWLRSRDYARLCDTVDEVAPQFYGNQWPEPGRRPPLLWETRRLIDAARRSARGRARVWIGLPAYGRCVVMDAAGRPVGMRHDLDPDELLDDPAWEVEAADTRFERWNREGPAVPVEDTLALDCRERAGVGPFEVPAGTRLWFQWPRADGLRSAVRELRASAPAGVDGVCFFRWPAPGEPLALPAAAMAAAVPQTGRGADPGVGLEVRLTRADRAVRVTMLNHGLDSPLLTHGIELEVLPPAGAEVQADGPVAWRRGGERASALRGDRAVFVRPLLRPGSRWEACQVDPALGSVQATIRWRGLEGQWHERSFWDRPAAGGSRVASHPEGLQ
jgi:uncharacterized protein DUF3142